MRGESLAAGVPQRRFTKFVKWALVEAVKSLLADVANEAEVEAAAPRWVKSAKP